MQVHPYAPSPFLAPRAGGAAKWFLFLPDGSLYVPYLPKHACLREDALVFMLGLGGLASLRQIETVLAAHFPKSLGMF